VPESVSIVLRPQFASWLGWVVPGCAAVVFVLDASQDRAELVRQARNIGYEELLGELDGGIDAWRAAGHPVDSIPVTPVEDVAGDVVDVRQRNEFEAGHLPGAVHHELGSITNTGVAGGAISVMCGHGERAMTAASLLARAGRGGLTVLTGGPDDWARRHGHLATGA
jgi:hydroxyacylglutathione hydrolase